MDKLNKKELKELFEMTSLRLDITNDAISKTTSAINGETEWGDNKRSAKWVFEFTTMRRSELIVLMGKLEELMNNA